MGLEVFQNFATWILRRGGNVTSELKKNPAGTLMVEHCLIK